MEIARTLDDLVTAAAADLMAATAGNSAAISQRVVRGLVGQFGVDSGFLRHNDHTIHATVLVAEWPPRENVPDPDPIGVVYFAKADPMFKMAENLKAPYVMRPEPENADYQRYIEAGTGVPTVSVASVPLLSGETTTGTLGFIKFGDREWLAGELNALQTIGTLFAQLQARIVAEERVHYLAEHDDLTDLWNRRALIAHLDERLTAGQPGPVSILFLDLDRFKVVNDHLGQNAGDQFIKAFSDIVRESVDVPAVISHFGGDEFVVVPAAAMGVESAAAFAQSLQPRLHRQVAIGGETLTRTVSIGVATGLPGHDYTSDLLRRAERATRSAKSVGGSTFKVYSPEESVNNAIRNDIELHFDGIMAKDSDAFVLHYLPEFDMRTGKVLGAEALVRWQHPTQGLVMPDTFIGLVESNNLAGKLGRLVMRSACANFALWRAEGLAHDAVLRVNVSPVQLLAEGIVDTVTATLDEFGLEPSALCLEVTENVLVKEIDVTRQTLTKLKDLGVEVAVDDFGTGYSSLAYLKSLPIDTLKVDRQFVRDLGESPRDLAILRAILALAAVIELDVVAEGVETVAAGKALLDLGCYRAQGFLLSRPLDSAAMGSLLSKRFLPMEFSTVGDS